MEPVAIDPQAVLGMRDTAMDNRVGEPCGSIQDLARNVYSARAPLMAMQCSRLRTSIYASTPSW
jgi:hypothetical protein